MWADMYNFARIAEYLGIGIWAGQDIAPTWEAGRLSRAIMEALDGPTSESMKKKAKDLAQVASTYGGRQTAAQEFARWAAAGQ